MDDVNEATEEDVTAKYDGLNVVGAPWASAKPLTTLVGPSRFLVEQATFSGLRFHGPVTIAFGSPTFTNCTFDGAALLVAYTVTVLKGATPTFTNCTFIAAQRGAVYLHQLANPTFSRTFFYGSVPTPDLEPAPFALAPAHHPIDDDEVPDAHVPAAAPTGPPPAANLPAPDADRVAIGIVLDDSAGSVKDCAFAGLSIGVHCPAGAKTAVVSNCSMRGISQIGIRTDDTAEAIFRDVVVHDAGQYGVYTAGTGRPTGPVFQGCVVHADWRVRKASPALIANAVHGAYITDTPGIAPSGIVQRKPIR